MASRAEQRPVFLVLAAAMTICTIIAWVRDGASGDGRSVSCIYDFSVTTSRKLFFLVSVSDCSECDSYEGD